MRWRRILFGVILCVTVLIAAAAAFMAWALFWPAPGGVPELHCREDPGRSCVQASGRILYHTALGRGLRGHVVLLSRASLTLPGVVSLEFPRLTSRPSGLGFGDWISVVGSRETGSHHEQDIHVSGFATSTMIEHCGILNSRYVCQMRKR